MFINIDHLQKRLESISASEMMQSSGLSPTDLGYTSRVAGDNTTMLSSGGGKKNMCLYVFILTYISI